MIKYTTIVTIVTLAILLVLPTPGLAHTLKIDQSIGVTLHIDPNDEPIAQKESTIYIEIEDRTKQFNYVDCDCRLLIQQDNRVIAELQTVNKLFRSATYQFPKAGSYQVLVAGRPKSPYATFQSFTTTFDFYVKSGNRADSGVQASAEQISNRLPAYFPYATLAIALIILLMFLVPYQLPRKD